MLLVSLGFLAALVGSALSTPVIVERDQPSWTLQSFTRTCNDAVNTCQYAFGVNKNDKSPTISCAYTINGTKDTSARVTDYHEVSCGVETPYELNQGWDNNTKSITLVVTDKSISFYAFFGYTGAQLVDGQAVSPDETQPAKPVGTFHHKRGAQQIIGAGWTVSNFSRRSITHRTPPQLASPFLPNITINSLTYNLTINTMDTIAGNWFDPFVCTITDTPDYRINVQTNSFDDVPCNDKEGVWSVSWNYNPADTALLTVHNVNLDRDAWAWFEYSSEASYWLFLPFGIGWHKELFDNADSITVLYLSDHHNDIDLRLSDGGRNPAVLGPPKGYGDVLS
ncbi:hypothetical protein B7494_g6628 [Chlorociboria aeruginascens]|nr:hypothetical protein B7494_g6628 [Chlorociboria aeruginascens]